jgi:hypothetical protein
VEQGARFVEGASHFRIVTYKFANNNRIGKKKKALTEALRLATTKSAVPVRNARLQCDVP